MPLLGFGVNYNGLFCIKRQTTVEQNLFQRLYYRVTGFFQSIFAQKSSDAASSGHPDHGHRDENVHAHHSSEHNHQSDHPNDQPQANLTLGGLDLSLFHKIDTAIGHGEEAFPGANVTVHYTGWLIDPNASDLKGQKFDSSVDRGQTFNFPLGQGHVIRGWDEGFAGMKIGGKRTLLIPPEMGYGARGAGGVIPPNATLMFEVELFSVN